MTIKVESTSAVLADKPAEAKPIETTSAPETKATEQNVSTESDTEEAEAKEETDKPEDKDSEEDAEPKDSENDKPRKKGGFQRRIDKLNARNADAQRELEYWKSLAVKKDAGDAKTEKADSKPVTADGKPIPDSFDTHAEYVEALTDWKIEQREKAAKENENKSKLLTEQENAIKAHATRFEAFSKKTADIEDVLAEVDDVPISPAVREIIISSENGPELMYELAKNRKEYERICSLPPLAAAREIGKIESKLSATEDKKPEPKKITKAPKPLDPVGSGKSGAHKDPNEMTQAEYEAYRREQMRKQA